MLPISPPNTDPIDDHIALGESTAHHGPRNRHREDFFFNEIKGMTQGFPRPARNPSGASRAPRRKRQARRHAA